MDKVQKSAVKVIGKTPHGKELGYRELGYNRFLEVAFKDGGEVPQELQGMWVNPMDTQIAIETYLNKLHQKFSAKEEKESKPLSDKARAKRGTKKAQSKE